MKATVTVTAYVSTMQEVELPDNFDVNDENAMYDLAHSEHIQSCLRDNVEDCLRENCEVVYINNEDTDEVLYE